MTLGGEVGTSTSARYFRQVLQPGASATEVGVKAG